MLLVPLEVAINYTIPEPKSQIMNSVQKRALMLTENRKTIKERFPTAPL